jgi:hypothetical protein
MNMGVIVDITAIGTAGTSIILFFHYRKIIKKILKRFFKYKNKEKCVNKNVSHNISGNGNVSHNNISGNGKVEISTCPK